MTINEVRVRLSLAETAYRRGALQAIQFLRRDVHTLVGPMVVELIARYEQELIAGRISEDEAYLGSYLDEIRSRVNLPIEQESKQ